MQIKYFKLSFKSFIKRFDKYKKLLKKW